MASYRSTFFSILLSFSLVMSTLHTAIAASSSSSSSSSISTKTLNTYKIFIKGYCSSTTYPKNCYKFLSPYASVIKTSPLILTRASIYIALKETSKSSYALKSLSKVKDLTHNETLVMKDCLENVYSSLYRVKQSAMSVKGLNGGDKSGDEAFEWSNIKTWMSAAITGYTTCTDGFGEKIVRASLQKTISSRVTKAKDLVSNALSVVNKFTY
ncbi:21 kDa protein-like [Neltuma alba]|uniref:21 kDa protein-like n=1 Tax=Neltuma alba TaxID=207710 RepID=UPI0010A587F0|nr:21 kDa protein-like [Prosopis alba]XP_028801742.1 21 kDa protein-like [Prosopis alba]